MGVHIVAGVWVVAFAVAVVCAAYKRMYLPPTTVAADITDTDTRTDTDGHGRTRTDTDGHGPTQIHGRTRTSDSLNP